MKNISEELTVSGVGWERNFGKNLENNSIKNASSERGETRWHFRNTFQSRTEIFLPNRNKRTNYIVPMTFVGAEFLDEIK